MNPRRLLILGLLLLAGCGLVKVGKSSQQLRATNLGFEEGSSGVGNPPYWSFGNADQTQWELATDTQEKRTGKQAVRIRSTVADPSGSAGPKQCVQTPAEAKALQFSGFLKTKGVAGSREDLDESGAGLIIRIADQPDTGEQRSFDNMKWRWQPGEDRHVDNRRVYGDSDWTLKSVKLLVPSAAGNTCFGALLLSAGVVWADDLKLEYSSSD
jgi:hypothetical protein